MNRFMPLSATRKKVNNLRDFELPGPVRTYRLNKDGSLTRVGTEEITEFNPTFQRRYDYKKRGK